MCSASLKVASTIFLLAAAGAHARELRVCADPNNLPFSNEAGQGFENRIVRLIGEDLGAAVTFHWRAQRRGFLRETLKAEACDLVPGAPGNLEGVRTTRPYYRSVYAFVTRAGGPQAATLGDASLRTARLGVQLIGDDGFNTPPAHSLMRRGIIDNVRGYMIYGDYRDPHPAARIVSAVAEGEIDVAIVWGPVAGFYAARQVPRLNVSTVQPLFDGPQLPMAFDISMAVRKNDHALHQEIDAALARLKPRIDAILGEYDVPRLDAPQVPPGERP